MGKVVRMRSKRNYSKKGKGKAKPTRKPKNPKRRKSTKRKSRKKRKSTKKKMKGGGILTDEEVSSINEKFSSNLPHIDFDRKKVLEDLHKEFLNYLSEGKVIESILNFYRILGNLYKTDNINFKEYFEKYIE